MTAAEMTGSELAFILVTIACCLMFACMVAYWIFLAAEAAFTKITRFIAQCFAEALVEAFVEEFYEDEDDDEDEEDGEVSNDEGYRGF